MPFRPLSSTAVARLVAGAAAACALLAPAAHANVYTVRPCSVGVVPYPGSNLFQADGATVLNDQCSSGGGLRMGFAGSAVQAGAGNGFRIIIPGKFPNARIRQLSGGVRIAPRSGSGGALFTIDETNGGYNPNGQPQLTFAAGAQITQEFFQAPTAPTRSVIWRLSSDGTTNYDATALGAHFVLDGINVDIDDSTPPLAPSFASTGLLDGAPQAGKRILTLTAKDEDSGVHDAIVRSAGGAQFANLGDAGVRCTYVSVQACPGERLGDVVVDTTQLPDGLQILTVRTIDAANNEFLATTPPFLVANAPAVAPPLVPNGDPKGQATVTRGVKSVVGPKRPASVSATWGRSVTLRGRLLAADGSPMAGAALDVTELPAFRGATTTKVATLTTDATGRYRHTFKARTSATLAVQYATRVGATDYSAAAATKLTVRSRVTLKTKSRRGRRVTLSGRVDATPIPAGGARVAIQYHLARGGWANADVITTGPTGRFSWKRTFRTPARYRLRARVLKDPRLAAAPSTSGEVRLRIR